MNVPDNYDMESDAQREINRMKKREADGMSEEQRVELLLKELDEEHAKDVKKLLNKTCRDAFHLLLVLMCAFGIFYAGHLFGLWTLMGMPS